VTRISIVELGQRGLAQLAAGDLNGDGWLDLKDLEAFKQGVRPQPMRKTDAPQATAP
jgi:hypothetical protein